MSGYDSAQRLKKDDDLGRWRFAAEIAEVIRSTPADWSARIGIFGKWGEGKSTILHFLEGMLKPEGNIVFYFTPWAVQELNELWAEFGKALLDALEEAELDVESPWKGMTRKVQETLGSTGLSDLGEGAAEFFGKDKLYKSALGLVGRWLKPDGAQVRKIRERLGERRVIAFIDDLDRATPELLPKLLLALREILDLPGFTFVLAFDNEIVADGLVTANKSWGDGDSFLDKILDFHYYLPPVSKTRKRLLLKNMLDRYAKFVPANSIDPVEHLLPDNPRKLKRLVRGLVSLQPQLARHGSDELNWVEIWLAEMVRQESYPFFMRLLDGGALESLIGIGYKIRKSERHRKGEDNEKNDDADIKKVIDEVGGINDKQSERLIELVNATRTLSGLHLEYNWKFALRPEAITWKEFHELLALWKKAPAPETISKWIEKQSNANSMDQTDIEIDLFQTFLNAKHNAAASAAEASTVADNADQCAEAQSLLKMTEQFLGLPGMFTPERFDKVYEKSTYWIAFKVNPADAELRNAEQALIFSLLDRVPDDQAPAILETLKPDDPWAFTPEDAHTAQLKRALRDECVARLLPQVERAFVVYLGRPESLRLLSTPKGSSSFRYMLFSPDRFPWGTVIRSALLDMLDNAKGNLDAYEKANEFLQLLVDAAGNRSNHIPRESAARIAGDGEFIAALWQGVTSRYIQFRMLKSFLSKRDALVQLGVEEQYLPLSPELAKAKETSDPAEVEPEESEANAATHDSDLSFFDNEGSQE
jgi:energy-coupling factor transporter ATP-binding protein EcfA2